MTKPTILTVDDDQQVLAAIVRDLNGEYGDEYRVLPASSGAQALSVLGRISLRDEPVALILADQRMPKMTGIELLEQALVLAPTAKLALLTAYADTDVAIRAINDIGLDYYLMKPWDPPAERLYPVLDDLLGDWQQAHPDHTHDVRVVDHRWSDRSYDLKMFLARNHVPYRWYDIERDAEAQRLSDLAQATATDLPLVLVPGGETLRAPKILEVAGALGLHTSAHQPLYDVCIVGGGPAGLAAAVYAASEGLSTVVVEREAPGGQAGQSAAIENYLGFPKGLSGSDLAQRAIAQVSRFGAEMVLAREVIGLESRGPVSAVLFDGAGEIEARTVVAATGMSYRRLPATGVAELNGRGIYYGASAGEASQCDGDDVYIVGAANSAGQAALSLARHARRVVLVVRGETLYATMSQYLVARITATPNIEVRCRSEVVAAQGVGHLERITLSDRLTGATEDLPASWLFIFIGASPRTDWLGPGVVRDSHGFVVTGPDLLTAPPAHPWPIERPPYALETSVPGVFAAGDVRLDSMKRVASAVGEGAMSIYLVHRYLAHDLMRVAELRALSIFDGLADEQLGELIAGGTEVAIVPGTELFQEGAPADFWWVLVDGSIDLVRHVGREETVVARMDEPGRWAGGFRAWDEAGTYLATGRGARPGRVLRVPAAVLRDRSTAWFPFGGHLIRGLYHTARSIESTVRQRESLVTLGTLAAGLAHEINNPAAAATRSVDALESAGQTLLSGLARLAEDDVTAAQFAGLDALRREIEPQAVDPDPLARADREQGLSAWLSRHAVGGAWRLAPPLAAAGVDPAWCARVETILGGSSLEPALEWVASTCSVSTLLAELKESTRRISELVAAMRSYSQLDRASLQKIEVADGLETTLVMLSYKLAEITVERDYGAEVTPIEAYAGELNQVWTNLIDNAIDAMDGEGTLRVATRNADDAVIVEIADTGSGMPPEVAAHAFEAFYTTKDVGKGTGLGLDIARRIVVEQHGGTISIDSQPGRTVLRIQLPIRPPHA